MERKHFIGLDVHCQETEIAVITARGRLTKRMRVPTTIPAPSLGGVETLITRPATTSHVGLTPEDRRRLGITDNLIRLSVGLEATDDLIEDFNRALGTY